MVLFIKMVFIFQIVTTILRLFDIYLSEWPKRREKSLGEAVADTLAGFGIIAWTGILIFYK